MPRRRLTGLVGSISLVAMLLVACSTGNAPEANRGQQQDTQRESVISDMQATHTWEMINSTPESTPETTPES